MDGETASGGWVGKPLRRREDRTLVTGRGRFVDDLALAGVRHLVLARSPHAHARIRSIDTSAALAMPGVVAVITAKDLGTIGPIPLMRLVPGTVVPDYPLLAAGVVSAQGIPVAAVVADSPYAALDAVERIAVDYEPLDGVADPDTALAAGAPQAVEASRDNRAMAVAWRHGDAERAFREAAHRVTVTVQQQRLAGVPLEPRGALARWDPSTDELTVWTSTQAPFRIRSSLARMLGLDEARIRVIAPDVGGGFGVKGGPYREEVLVAWLARRLGQAVKWVSTRAEDLLTTNHGRGGRATGELALDAEGRIKGLRARIRQPLGATLAVTVGGTPQNYGRCLPGPYLVEHVDIESVGVFTTTPPVGAYRGAGRPEAAFLIERLVDEAARTLKVDPAELRRRNLIPPERFPFKTATGQVYDSGDYPALFERTLAAADYAGLRRAQAARRARGEIVGIGVAAYVEPSGLGWESGLIRVEQTGAVLAITGSSAHGQGHETTFAQIVADELGVAPEVVTVRHGDTHGAPQGIGTFGSRSTALGGSALALAARDVREKARRLAGGMLEAAVDDVVAVDGGFGVIGAPGRTVTLARVAEFAYRGQGLPPGTEPGLEATRFFSPEGEVWSAGAFVVSIRIDRDTGTVTPERIVWVDDAGTIINPLLADGQLEGSLAQGWGQAMMEEIALDAGGQVLSGTLMDYAIPRADDVPHAEIGHAHSPSPRNPLGAKGIGEAGTIGIPPVMVSAVVDALSPFGVSHLDMPLTPERIWRSLAARR
ncbi:MAG: xanthine dehydrogenase [Candidatus Rokuibacteriota bacterium]|nr:MAG: xanthine dehydrogenase [Candidatus Rokubacteria bacterium]